jgi:hypothetical protein
MTVKEIIPSERILNKIYFIRGRKVMLDTDLAELYEVETGQLKRQVRRNIERFPDDFMFELTQEEYRDFLRCQFGILKRGEHAKYVPMAFTEQGVAMLSSVLNSKRAIQVNIQIIRVFTYLRQMISDHDVLRRKIEAMEKKYDKQFSIVFKAIRELLDDRIEKKSKVKNIGFKIKGNGEI